MELLATIIICVLGFITLCVILAWIEYLCASFQSPITGLIPLSVYLVLMLILSIPAAFKHGILAAILLILTLNIPLLISLVIYLVKRRKKYLFLLDAFKKQTGKQPISKRTPISYEVRARISGFYDSAITLSREVQRDVLSAMKSGYSTVRITAMYKCTEKDITALSASFDRYCLAMTEKERGITYTLSEKQGELFLQLMINSTPRAVGTSGDLLWTKHSLRELVCSTINENISLASIEAFMTSYGLVIPENMTVGAKKSTPAFENWIENDFEKLRMRSLEEGTDIAFIYSVGLKNPSKGKKMTMLAAVPKSGIVSFGVYRGEGGHKDFLDKLIQEHGNRLFAVVDDALLYAKFSGISSEAEIFSTNPSNIDI